MTRRLRRLPFRNGSALMVGLGLRDGGEHAAELRVAVQYEFDRGTGARGDFLFDMGNLQVRRPVDVASVSGELAANRRDQTRLAGAVGAGDPDLVAAEYGEIDLLEQRLRTAPQGEIPSR